MQSRPRARGAAVRIGRRVRVPTAFYRRVLELLQESRIPFLVGGGYAFAHHTGIDRHTVDLDIFVTPEDVPRVMEAGRKAGYRARVVFAHWLGKVYQGDRYVDVIWSSGNGVARVDHEWFDHAPREVVFGHRVRLVPAEEMIWSKSFVMERERFDGNDILHLIRAHGRRLDWSRLLRRFGPHWRVLAAYAVLFGFAYPGERGKIPAQVMRAITRRLTQETSRNEETSRNGEVRQPVCLGTLLSRQQFLPDLSWGYHDGRLTLGTMNRGEIERWTAAAEEGE
jgi:hypothetical protein